MIMDSFKEESSNSDSEEEAPKKVTPRKKNTNSFGAPGGSLRKSNVSLKMSESTQAEEKSKTTSKYSNRKSSVRSSGMGIYGLQEDSVINGVTSQKYHKEAKKFKENFGKIYSQCATISMWNMKYRFISDDAIFKLVEPFGTANPYIADEKSKGKCPCCYRGLGSNGMSKKMVDCQFCGQKVCQECGNRKRPFPKQAIFEGTEKKFGSCCVLCDRKFYMKNKQATQ